METASFFVIMITILAVSLGTILSSHLLLLREHSRARREARYVGPWFGTEASGDWVEAEGLVRSIERERRLALTPGARTMLTIPIAEALGQANGFDWPKARASLLVIATELYERPDQRDSGTERSSFSVVRAFHSRFCNIPPFCAPPEGAD